MTDRGTVTSTGLNLRAKPHADAPIIDKLAKGDELEILDRLPTDWLQVRTNSDRVGFVYSEFVKVRVSPVPPPSHPPPLRPAPTKPAPDPHKSLLWWCLIGGIFIAALTLVLWLLP